ncbi:hypothetical protein SUGI_0124290 [Cryptomeria japonica]|uniref:uncharacterized protein LOC131049977 n=1 Tax=Cryptomeria japonica TaxID=3369 RepID=UPI002408A4FD|nr:uncharacterized protein LOC131049977 [Cryptomeria japonica]GLJ10221.1 hypothetical protein SUGI_0124290 [Cryptomeria japonica]
MATTLKNAISSGEYFQWGARKRMTWDKPHLKQAEEAMENKPAIRFDRRVVRADKEAAAVVIPCSLDEKIALPCNNSSSHALPLPPESSRPQNKVNNIMCTRSSNYSNGANTVQDNKALNMETFVWPNVCLSLSHGEKEEDFLAMKGSKLPLRPKKRLKCIQRAIHNVIPGGWLSDICQERYEVREKKCIKKRPRGLKAMGRAESDSE